MTNFDEIVFPIKNTNRVFFDYPTFNQYVSKTVIYPDVVSHIIKTIQNVLKDNETFEIHVNLYSFNTSSLAKHTDFLRIFASYSNLFGKKLTHFYVYYTPSIMDLILKIISTQIFNRENEPPQLITYSKKDSAEHLRELSVS